MQSRFWQCDDVLVGLDDRDVKVRFTHFVTHAVVTVCSPSAAMRQIGQIA